MKRAIALVASVLVLAGCGSSALDDARAAMPDLTDRGYTLIECSDGQVVSLYAADSGAELYRPQCWTGTPGVAFYDEANSLAQSIIAETRATDYTAAVCGPDTFTEAVGMACRAVLFGSGDDAVVLGVTVVLTDAATAAQGLSDEPTSSELFEALVDQEVEIIIGPNAVAPND